MTDIATLKTQLEARFPTEIASATIARRELTVEVKPESLLVVVKALRDEAAFAFNQLMDICGIDYLHYGLDDWQTKKATETGFSRGVTARLMREEPGPENRFDVIYNLLSLEKNHRIRLRVSLPNSQPFIIDSVISIWPAANWFEREAFDLYGILFKDHPDLRRILTDYGFVGHPFRKDFPLIGNVEMRYDAKLKRVIYEPVSITMRTLEPKVIRHDNRYDGAEGPSNDK
jgi:NADH-quinone oxidoreductase subunit C